MSDQLIVLAFIQTYHIVHLLVAGRVYCIVKHIRGFSTIASSSVYILIYNKKTIAQDRRIIQRSIISMILLSISLLNPLIYDEEHDVEYFNSIFIILYVQIRYGSI